MALDGLFLHSIVTELKKPLIGGRISKINQPEKDELNLLIRGNDNTNYKLLISASSTFPKIHFTDTAKPNPLKAPMFCMVLRKYLGSSRILDIKQLNTDRVVLIDFDSVDELGFNSVYTLIIEIMGRHSNITLVRQRDGIIMDSIKHITPEINRYRSLYPGIEYIYPPTSIKLNPFNFSKNEFFEYINKNEIKLTENSLTKIFTGLSTPLSKEIFLNFSSTELNSDTNTLNKLFDLSSNLLNKVKSEDFSLASYSKNGVVKDFYCIKLNFLKDLEEKIYSSPSKLISDFYYEKDKAERLNSKSSNLQKLLNTNLDRCNKKSKILNEKLEECKGKDTYKIYGELLTANIYSLKQGEKEVSLLNYYSENNEYIKIKLNENKTASENIQAYYKKYNKLKKSEEMALIQLDADGDRRFRERRNRAPFFHGSLSGIIRSESQ